MEGNQMKMREALVFCLRIIGENGIRGNVFIDDIREAHRAITAALAAPPRNCDVYDPDKAAHMMEVSYCGQMPPSHCDGTNCTRCSFKWFTSPAEEGGAK
jgi:hypothetical protein